MNGPRLQLGSALAALGAALLFGSSLVGSQPPEAQGSREWFVEPGGTGSGSEESPLGRIQDGLREARAGDVITVRPGTYRETLRTVRGGEEGKPIVVRADGNRGSVVVVASGRVLSADHPFVIFDGLVFDGEYGSDDTVLVRNGATQLVIRNCEVRRSSRDLIDIRSPEQVLIENCLVHHALNAANVRTDAHGIAAGAVRDLIIRDTEIHTFSGDGLQVDPRRGAPGWNRVTVEGARIWLAPLPEALNGFPAGVVPGENAVDTKANADLPRASLTIRNTKAWGFRDGLIGNMAAFNLKENVDVTLDGVTVMDSEIAFRLRGPTGQPPAGAHVTVKNAVIYEVKTAFRYENDIEQLRIWNSTIGAGVGRLFQRPWSRRTRPDVRNLLVLNKRLPPFAPRDFNLALGPQQFVDAAAHLYRLMPGSPAIDAGAMISEVSVDRDGVPRPQGRAYDIGAYEHAAGADDSVVPLR